MRDFIDAAGEGAAAYFDAGNILVNGYPDQWIDILGDRICKIHVKDFSNKIGNINGFVDLFSGSVDFKSVMNALRRIGYDDYITAEYGCHKAAPEAQLTAISAALDKILSY
jgi:hexulose-6-phosphate isomerase